MARRGIGRLILTPSFVLLVGLSVWGLGAPPSLRCSAPGAIACPGGLLGEPIPAAGNGSQFFNVTLYDYGFWIVDSTNGTNDSSVWNLYEGFTINLNVTSLSADSSKGGTGNHGVGLGTPISYALDAPTGKWSTGSFVAPKSAYSGVELYCSHYCGSGHSNMYEYIVNVVPGPDAPRPSISGTPLSGPAPLQVSFTGTETGGTPPFRFMWQFGDGNNATSLNASNTYLYEGLYYARLSVWDSKNLSGTSGPLTINVTAPVALVVSASATPRSGAAPLNVNFTTTASGGTPPYSFSWSFGDGGTATGANTTHSYLQSGYYQATVTCVDQGHLSKQAIISISVSGAKGPLNLILNVTPQVGDAPVEVNASASISGGSPPYGGIVWDWGDGGTATGPIVNHTFEVPGSYQVTASVTDSAQNTVNALAYVNISKSPSLSVQLLSGGQAGSVRVTLVANATDGTPPFGQYRWSFGDRTGTGAGAVVNHSYPGPGDYEVVVTTNDSVGQSVSAFVWVNLTGSPAVSVQGSGAATTNVLTFLGVTGVLGLLALVISARWERQGAPEPTTETYAEESESAYEGTREEES